MFPSHDQGGGDAAALANVIAFAPTGWTLDTTNGYATLGNAVYGSFAGETVLAALRKMSEQRGEHFRLSTGRSIAWIRTDQTDSGIRAIQPVGDGKAIENNDDVCIIDNLTESQDSYELITRVYPFGAGQGRARLTLEKTTRTPNAGYVLNLDSKGYYIESVTARATYGQIEKFVSFKEIKPVTNTEADLESAANALFDAAFQYLSRHDTVQKAYTLSVTKLEQIVYPGQTIRVIWREVVDNYVFADIDADLIILETKTKIDQTGLRVVGLTVATTDRWPTNDAEIIAGQLEEARLMDAHPQTIAGYYTDGFGNFNLDSSISRTIRFRFDNRVTRLISAVLRFRTEEFEATSSGVAAAPADTSGASSATSSLGGTEHEHDSITIQRDLVTSQNSNHKEIHVHQEDNTLHFFSTDAGASTIVPVSGGEAAHSHNIAHTHNIDGHTHNLSFGVIQNTGEFAGPISLVIDGVDRTAVLGGPWGTDSATSGEVEVEVADYLNDDLRREHTIEFVAAGGQGVLSNVAIRNFVQVQAILLS